MKGEFKRFFLRALLGTFVGSDVELMEQRIDMGSICLHT